MRGRRAFIEDEDNRAKFAPGVRVLREASWRASRGFQNRKMRHHFGWEDEALVETVLSGDWRCQFNGSQHYLEEEDGYDDDDLLYNRCGEKRRDPKRKYGRPLRNQSDDDDELQAYPGRNFYDDGWDFCALEEEVLKENDSKGVLVQDSSLTMRNNDGGVISRPSTYVLNISDFPKSTTRAHAKHGNSRKLLSWRRIEGEEDRLDEILNFLRDLLMKQKRKYKGYSKNNAVSRNPERSFALHLRKCDRHATGLLSRERFEDCLARFGLLKLLNSAEIDMIADSFATSQDNSSDDILYRRFLRHLFSNKDQAVRSNLDYRTESDDSSSNEDGHHIEPGRHASKGSTMISGSWRGVPFQSRCAVRMNCAPVHGPNGYSDNVKWSSNAGR